MVTKEEFLSDVAHEVQMLKEHATLEEINKLDFDDFNNHKTNRCIYGQMTGDCRTIRAKELMDVACIRVMNVEDGTRNCTNWDDDFKINGVYNGQTWQFITSVCDGFYRRDWSHLSALEAYICLHDAKVENIYSFLKGEVDTLEL